MTKAELTKKVVKLLALVVDRIEELEGLKDSLEEMETDLDGAPIGKSELEEIESAFDDAEIALAALGPVKLPSKVTR